MKVLFIYPNGFANNNGSNHLLSVTIQTLLKRGHSVDLIEGVSFRENDDYPKELNRSGFKCHTIEMPKTRKTSFVKRYLDGISFAKKTYKVAKTIDFDVCFVQSSPTILYVVNKIKKLKKPIVYNIYDVFPGSAYEIGVLKYKFLDSFFRILQRKAYKKSNSIIVVSEDMRDILIKEKVDSSKITVIYTWFDSSTISYISNESNSFVIENNIDTNKLIVQYAGNVGQVFGLDEFVKLVNGLKDNNSIEFHIIGSGVKLESLKEKTKDSNIKFFGWQPQSRMNEIYSYCDLEIIPLHHGVIGNDVPSKMALAMACGKVVFNIVEKSHYYNQFIDNNLGFSFSQDEIPLAIEKLNDISKNKNILDNYKENVIKYSANYYSSNINSNKVVDLLEKVFEGVN